MSIISIDSGSSFLKIFDGENQPRSFPAVIKEVKMEAAVGRGGIQFEGSGYLAGDAALLAAKTFAPNPYLEAGFHGSRDQRIQICHALDSIGACGNYDALVLSLPYSDSQNHGLQTAIQGRLSFEWQGELDGHWTDMRAVFGEICIVPQGVGALEHSRLEHGEEEALDVVVMIDIGSCTTDIVVVCRNPETGDVSYNLDASCTVENMNVTTFKNLWQDRIAQAHRGMGESPLGYHALMGHAVRGNWVMQYGPQRLDLRPAFDSARAEFEALILDAIKSTTGGLWNSANRIILTGGGARLLDLNWNDPRVEVLDTYANVRGQHALVAQRLESKPVHVPVAASNARRSQVGAVAGS